MQCSTKLFPLHLPGTRGNQNHHTLVSPSPGMDWRFVQQPTNRTVKEGDNVTLVCRAPRSPPPARVSWIKEGRPLSPPLTTAPAGDLVLHRSGWISGGRVCGRVSLCNGGSRRLSQRAAGRCGDLLLLGLQPAAQPGAVLQEGRPHSSGYKQTTHSTERVWY